MHHYVFKKVCERESARAQDDLTGEDVKASIIVGLADSKEK